MIEHLTFKLGEIATFVNGRAYSMPEMLKAGKYRIIRVGNFTGKDEWYYSDMELEPEKYCENGDLLYKWACTFGPEIWTEEKAIYHYHIWKVIPNSRYVDKDYLYYLLKQMTEQFLKAAHGSTMIHITKEIMESNVVNIPKDVSVQHQIAMILKTIDCKISNNNAICADLEGMAKLLYDYWFVQFDFPDENGEPYKSYGGKMVWNEELKREIPEGWKVQATTKYLKPIRGISYSADDLLGEGISMLNLNSFNEDGTYKASGIKCFSGEVPEERTLAPNDLIMCVTQQTDIDLSGKKNVIGKALLVPSLDEDVMTMSMDVVKLVAENKSLLAFFKYLFGLRYAHKYVVGYANGTKIKHLDIDGALSLPVAMPPKESTLIEEFSDRAIAINEAISNTITENKKLADLRDFLLPMLMNGQVKVGKETAS